MVGRVRMAVCCRFAINILRACAFVSLHSKLEYIRKVVVGVIISWSALHTLTLILFLLLVENKDFGDICVGISYLGYSTATVIKLHHLNYTSGNYIDNCKYLTSAYLSIEKKYNIPENLRFENVEKKVHKMAVFLFYYSFLIVTTSIVYVAFIETNLDSATSQNVAKLPSVAWYPFDFHMPSIYELCFIFQTIGIYLMHIGLDCRLVLCISQLYHCRNSFLVLHYLLKNVKFHAVPMAAACILNTENIYEYTRKINSNLELLEGQEHGEDFLKCSCHACPEECEFYFKKSQVAMDIQIRDCIIYHMKILEYFKRLNRYMDPHLLLDLTLVIVILMATTVAGLELQSAQVVPMFGLLTWSVIYIFLFCWFSSDIQLQSEYVAAAAYMSDWEYGSASYKKSLCILLTRAQKGCTLNVGSLYPVNLNVFISVLQAAFSNLTFLRSMKN